MNAGIPGGQKHQRSTDCLGLDGVRRFKGKRFSERLEFFEIVLTVLWRNGLFFGSESQNLHFPSATEIVRIC